MDADSKARLARAELAIRRLERIRSTCPSAAEYGADSDLQAIAERYAQVSVEALVDPANVLIDQKRWGAPESAAKAILTLVQNGILSRSHGDSLIRWVKTRNIIVREYARIDNTLVFASLRRHLPALRRGIRIVAKACGPAR